MNGMSERRRKESRVALAMMTSDGGEGRQQKERLNYEKHKAATGGENRLFEMSN
jgi:hypothetical protein